MNIEIANRLVGLRKKNGLSQEELADKLGLSRQAVSKWERAESSPDTDNLICLAKLYNVSLDELLKTDQDIEEISEEVREKEEEKVVESNECKNESLEEQKRDRKINTIDGVITGILFGGALFTYILVSCLVPDQWGKLWVLFFVPIIFGSIIDAIKRRKFTSFCYPLLATFIFLTIGVYANVWHPTWAVFPFIPLYYAIFSPVDAVIAKNRA